MIGIKNYNNENKILTFNQYKKINDCSMTVIKNNESQA